MKIGNKKIFPLVFSVFVIIGVLLLIKFITKNNQVAQEGKTPTEERVGGDKDEHGCIGSAGYTWCKVKEKCLREWEEPCENEEVFNLLKKLGRETQIEFSGIVETEFVWNTEGEKVDKEQEAKEITVTGKGFDAVKISNSQHESVETFFNNNGFEVDMYNLAAGTIVALTGYKKDRMACVAVGGISGYKEAEDQWVPSEFDKHDVEVKCGLLEE